MFRPLREGLICRAILLAALLSCATPLVLANQARPSVRGIPNFDAVTERIFRGGQPRLAGYHALKELGVDLVISFRGDGVAKERKQVGAEGMQFVNIPWNGFRYPSSEQVKQFFDLVDSSPNRKIFLHCRHGSERTGVMVALYRIARQGWTGEEAYREMQEHGFHSFWFHHLREYVFDFAREAHARSLPQAVPAVVTQK